MLKFRSVFSCLLLMLVLYSPSASAGVVVLIDVTDPSAVVITATTVNSSATIASTAGAGIAFENFFFSAVSSSDVDSEVSRYFSAFDTPGGVGLISQGTGNLNLSPGAGDELFLGGSPIGREQPMNFTIGTQAFFGERIFDLSAVAGFLPSAGKTGDIYARLDSDGTGPLGAFDTVVGQYRVIPEPSALIMVMISGLVLLGRKRRGA